LRLRPEDEAEDFYKKRKTKMMRRSLNLDQGSDGFGTGTRERSLDGYYNTATTSSKSGRAAASSRHHRDNHSIGGRRDRDHDKHSKSKPGNSSRRKSSSKTKSKSKKASKQRSSLYEEPEDNHIDIDDDGNVVEINKVSFDGPGGSCSALGSSTSKEKSAADHTSISEDDDSSTDSDSDTTSSDSEARFDLTRLSLNELRAIYDTMQNQGTLESYFGSSESASTTATANGATGPLSGTNTSASGAGITDEVS